MAKAIQPRLSIEPILRLFPLGNARAFEYRTGYSRRTLSRWKQEGAVPLDAADKLAAALGKHPIELWPDEWEMRDDDELEVAS